MNVKFALLIGLSLCFCACTPEEDETSDTPQTVKEEVELIEIENGMYSEYYPGKKQVKFQGRQDIEGRRNGVWRYYSETGVELSMTEYRHGKRHGITLVKYPNGVVHYLGEYKNDQEIGLWKTYDEQGKLVTEKDFGEAQ